MRLTLIIAAGLALTPAFATDFPPLAPELKALDAQSGHWVYHGTTAFDGKPGTFTWDEHCSWSSNKLFLTCSFDNDWSGEKIRSEVVDTWNAQDKSYWHYEVFAVGGTGANPFSSKMTIAGDTWTEVGEDDDKGEDLRPHRVQVQLAYAGHCQYRGLNGPSALEERTRRDRHQATVATR